MKYSHLYAFGFPDDDPIRQKTGLDIKQVDIAHWPSDAPVIVHSSVWTDFQELIDTDDTMADSNTILYIPEGFEEPEDAWMYFDDVVSEGDWKKLKDIAAFPDRFEIEEWALSTPIRTRGAQPPANEDLNLDELDLPDGIRKKLQDPSYKKIFNDGLNLEQAVFNLALGKQSDLVNTSLHNEGELTVNQVSALKILVAGLYLNKRLVQKSKRSYTRSGATIGASTDEQKLDAWLKELRNSKSIEWKGDNATFNMVYHKTRNSIQIWNVRDTDNTLYTHFDVVLGSIVVRSKSGASTRYRARGTVEISLDDIKNSFDEGATEFKIRATPSS